MADETVDGRVAEPEVAEWVDHVAYLREAFVNDLVRRGFRLTGDKSDGAQSDTTLIDGRVTVLIEDGFPYNAPRVRTEVIGPMSWHRDRLGYICLYTALDNEGQPWLDADAFLARIEEWFTKNDEGWPDDPPALDLEAYLDLPIDIRYVLYPELSAYANDYVKFRVDGIQLRLERSGKVARNSTKGHLSGYVTDIGEVITPPLNWDDLIDNVAEPDKIRSAIQRDCVDVLLVQYRRGSQRGALAVTFPSDLDTLRQRRKGGNRRRRRHPETSGAEGAIRRPHLAFSGSTGESAMRLRSGITAAALEDMHVYLIGVGALGSHVCDGLVRAGLGHLTVRDGDILTPGNMTRHLVAALAYAGHYKASAVEAVLKGRPYSRTKYECVLKALRNPAEAAELLRNYDLVVDATADGAVTSMLEAAAGFTNIRFVTTCLQNDGRSMRVDVIPPLDGASSLPETVIRPSSAPEAFEAGCGLPISPTPPHAVTEAAAMTVRHILGLLAGVPESPAGEHRDFG